VEAVAVARVGRWAALLPALRLLRGLSLLVRRGDQGRRAALLELPAEGVPDLIGMRRLGLRECCHGLAAGHVEVAQRPAADRN
jgi:hypothetical protein